MVAGMTVQVPHFTFPFRFGADGSARVLEQDTQEEVEQGVKVLILTELGERLEVPDFGVEDPTFQTGIDVEQIAAAATGWDERATVFFDEGDGTVVDRVRRLLVQVTTEEG